MVPTPKSRLASNTDIPETKPSPPPVDSSAHQPAAEMNKSASLERNIEPISENPSSNPGNLRIVIPLITDKTSNC